MADQAFSWRKTFILGFGFFGISIIWPFRLIFLALAIVLMTQV